MSDLFKSALGYWSSSTPSASAPSSFAPNQEENTSSVGEVITFPSGQRVRITRLIAEGGFSYVFKGVDVQSGEVVAIKKIVAVDEEARKAVEEEKEFLGQFQHEHIAKYFGPFVRKQGKMEEHYLGMEFCPIQLPTPPLRLQHTVQVFAQTCRAIKYLHDFGIVHRDIKLENVLIGSDGLVKLVDFGSATLEKYYPTPDWSMTQRTLVEEAIAAKTTPMYRAPEMLDLWSNYPIDEGVDMWALGCLLFALNFGSHPFQDSNKLAITNANYSIPKGVSDSGPIVTIIRGLLKVDPKERMSFGQIFDVLVSIAESQGFSLNGPLPWKPTPSPQPVEQPQQLHQDRGIVNPLASQGQSSGNPLGGSLFSSLKGGAASLIKNIKEQSQQYLGPTGSSANNEVVGSHQHPHPPLPSRPAPPIQRQSGEQPNRPPPPRPCPPSPQPVTRRKSKDQPVEFENFEYHARNPEHAAPPPPRPAPPSPKHQRHEQQHQQQPKVANLLDMSFDSGSGSMDPPVTSSQTSAASNTNLLEDLFGNSTGSQSQSAVDDLFSSGIGNNTSALNSQPSYNTSSTGKEPDLLGDPLASIFGSTASSLPTKPPPSMGGFAANFGAAPSQPFLQPMGVNAMPQSASFQNLNSATGSSNLIGLWTGRSTHESKIPKNSSSPNLLSDLILDDIITSKGFNKINLNTAESSNGNGNGNGTSQPTKPNYSRTQLFEQPTENKKPNLNDVFGDILTSQGFEANKDNQQGRKINELRKIEALSSPNANPTQIKVNEWREGKKKNIRALLASLHTITWEECSWEEANMSQMITPAQVKKTYRKACLAVHPDKQMGEEWEELARMIFVELNEAWAAFEESQQ